MTQPRVGYMRAGVGQAHRVERVELDGEPVANVVELNDEEGWLIRLLPDDDGWLGYDEPWEKLEGHVDVYFSGD